MHHSFHVDHKATEDRSGYGMLASDSDHATDTLSVYETDQKTPRSEWINGYENISFQYNWSVGCHKCAAVKELSASTANLRSGTVIIGSRHDSLKALVVSESVVLAKMLVAG